ncbi:MAG: SCO1664 family protein [Actinomycetota bacterium]|nr:SCO1664 family protein [Actinomycetota bacterium]
MTPDVVALLGEAPLAVHGRIANASNHTTLVQVGEPDLGVLAVYKPMAGERPLWDFPTGTLHRREVAAFLISDFLGWHLVPPTLRRDGPFGVGSLQLFVPHDPGEHYFVLVESDAYDEQLARMAMFDLLVNNADRKAGHVLLDDEGHIWGCDHGLTFHPQPKLRTVIWEFAGMPLPQPWRDDVGRLGGALDGELGASLAGLLSPREVAVLGRRAAALCDLPALPTVAEEYRPYPWPPL